MRGRLDGREFQSRKLRMAPFRRSKPCAMAVVWHVAGRRAQNEVEWAALTTPQAASLAYDLSISLLEFKTWYQSFGVVGLF